jgi:LDH2 family malate/lactate/ureidoglycolate dehydrogenase
MTQQFFYQQLLTFTTNIFLQMGSTASNASVAAKALLSADLRGVDSHGIARLSGYVRLWKANRVNANPNISIVHQTPSTAVVDGDKGLGLVVAPAAMQIAIDKAKNVGTGWVSVKNSNHFGIAGYHAMMALEHDMIGIAMTNASATVAPTFSKERLLGTNPIAVVIPAGKEQPIVCDFATTTAANGKLEVIQRKNGDAPHGWVQNKDGHPSTDAHELKKGGAMLPLGGDIDHGSHKGYMLGSIVDIFSGILSGANFGPWVPPFPAYLPMPENMPGEGIGHFFGAMRIDAFRPAADFKADMDQWIQRFKTATPVNANQPIIIPGEPERALEKDRLANGLNLMDAVVEDLKQLGEEFSVVI